MSIATRLRFGFFLCVSVSYSVSANVNTVISTTEENPVIIGAGYDSDFGSILDSCILWEKDSTEKSSGGAISISYTLNLIESVSEFERQMGVSASAKYGAVSGKAEFVKSIRLNNYNIYVLVEVSVKNQNQMINQVKLEDDIVKLAEERAERFKDVCGTHYIHTITRGGEFFGVLEIVTSSAKEKEEITASIKGSMGKFSAQADAKDKISSVVKNKSVKVSSFASGTDGTQALPTDVVTLLAYGSTFPKAAIENSTPFSAIMRPYTTVRNYPDIPIIAVDNRKDLLEKIARKRLQSIGLYNNIDFILNNVNQFESVDENRLTAHRDSLSRHIDTLTKTARECVVSADNCLWDSLGIDAITLPERKDGVTMVCKPQRHKSCGIESYVLRQSEACGFTIDSGTGPECGIKNYRTKKSEHCGATTTHSIYMWPKRATNPTVKLKLCQDKGYEMTTGRIGCHPGAGHCTPQPNNNEFLECGNYNTCEHEEHGIESLNTCRHENFGKTFKICRHESHEVELYKMCNINLDTGSKCS